MSSESSYSGRTVLNSVAAGYCAGVSGTIVGHPLDSLKVWLQTSCSQQKQVSHSLSSLRDATPRSLHLPKTSRRAMSTLAANGITRSTVAVAVALTPADPVSLIWKRMQNLYAGVTGPLLTVGLVQSVNFAVYDSCRRMLYHYDHPDSSNSMEYLHADSLVNVGLSSMAGGFVISLITNPMLLVKTKQQTTAKNHNIRLGFKEAFQQIAKNTRHSIFRQVYTGYTPHCAAEVVGRGVYFVAYEHLKRNCFSQSQGHSCTLPERMISAASAGMLCWGLIFPLDVLRNRMYASAGNSNGGPTGVVQMASSLYQTGGWRPFYRGFWITILRAGPVAAFVLPIYDLALDKVSQI